MTSASPVVGSVYEISEIKCEGRDATGPPNDNLLSNGLKRPEIMSLIQICVLVLIITI